MESFLIKALQLILSLSILVIVHEFGHFIFSRMFKVRVEKFYLFFNPWFSLFKFKPKNSETEYGIGWLPLGGYVKISGMIDESMDKEQMAQPPQPWEFRSKPAGQRLMIMIGGVLFNFILAFFIYAMIIFKWGDSYIPIEKTPLYFSELGHKVGFQDNDVLLSINGKKQDRYDELLLVSLIKAKEVTVLRQGKEQTIVLPKDFKYQFLDSEAPLTDIAPAIIDSLIPGLNAEKAGFQIGDQVIGVNDKETVPFSNVVAELSKNKDKQVNVKIVRNGEQITLPVKVDENGTIGFSGKKNPTVVTDNYNFFQSFPVGIKSGIKKLTFYVSQMEFIFTKKGASSIGGFGAIGSLFPPVWDWFSFWSMTAFLSIILGFMNILPIPALDGGHVMFLLYEVITRRKPSDKFLEYAQTVGMVLLLGLVLYANANDIYRYFFK